MKHLLVIAFFMIGCASSVDLEEALCPAPSGECEIEDSSIRVDLNPQINHIRDVRSHLDRVDLYRELMRKALELHDQGDIAEAMRVSSQAGYLFSQQDAATWLASELEKGVLLSEGDHISFINRSGKHVHSITLRYKQHKVTATDLRPGTSHAVFAENLPKGSVRLKIEVDMEGDWGHRHGGRLFLSGRFHGSEHGFTTDVVITEDGRAEFE